MNAIRCPKCFSTNQISAAQCQKCGMSFINLPSTAHVSVSAEELYQMQNSPFNPMPQDNEIGRKTFFWYRIYCAVLMVLYLLITVMGIYFTISRPTTREYSSEETFIMGIAYALIGAIFFILFTVAILLPRKPYNWIVGIVAIALGMTSCCFLPFTVPLLIYWVKPETKAYFGRK